MSGSVNKVILVGNLGRDPETRQSSNGQKIVTFTLATSDTWRDKNSGERQEKTEWHRIVIFNAGLADIAEKYLRKGSKVYIEGSLQTRKWTDQNGMEKSTTEIVLGAYRGELVLFDTKASAGAGAASTPFGGSDAAGWDAKPVQSGSFDDDIPF